MNPKYQRLLIKYNKGKVKHVLINYSLWQQVEESVLKILATIHFDPLVKQSLTPSKPNSGLPASRNRDIERVYPNTPSNEESNTKSKTLTEQRSFQSPQPIEEEKERSVSPFDKRMCTPESENIIRIDTQNLPITPEEDASPETPEDEEMSSIDASSIAEVIQDDSDFHITPFKDNEHSEIFLNITTKRDLKKVHFWFLPIFSKQQWARVQRTLSR